MMDTETITPAMERLRDICIAMIDIIALHGKNGMPRGHLYAQMMGRFNFQQYQLLEDVIVLTGKVRRSGDLLFAV